MKLPIENPYFPDDLSVLLQTNSESPTVNCIERSNEHLLFYGFDTTFLSPTVFVQVYFYTQFEEKQDSLLQQIFHEVRQSLMNLYMKEFMYTAEMANLVFQYSESVDFIKVTFEGYQCNISAFIENSFRKLNEFTPQQIEDQFETVKDNWSQEKNEFYYKKPAKQCLRYLGPILSHVMVDEMALMDGEEKLDFETFSKMNSLFFK